MIITRAPYRVSFFGGGTDYNAWFERHGGLVINSSFARYCYITIRKLPPFFAHKGRIVYSQTEYVKKVEEIKHPSIRNCLKYLDMDCGLEIHHDGDLPAWSGIGSSSSFTVAMLLALKTMRGGVIDKYSLARDAIFVEQTLSAENVGIQDQIASSWGGMQVIEAGPGKEFRSSSLELGEDYKRYLEQHILLGFSGQTRLASINAKGQVERISRGEVDSQMLELFSIAEEGLQAFKQEASANIIGELLRKSWLVKRSLTDQISNAHLDKIFEAGIFAGAWGGKLLGAGGGGFFMFIVPPEKQERLKEKLGDQIRVWIPFKFENEGAQVVFYDQSV